MSSAALRLAHMNRVANGSSNNVTKMMVVRLARRNCSVGGFAMLEQSVPIVHRGCDSTSIAAPQTQQPPQIRYYSSTSPASKDYPPHTLFPMPALSPTMETGSIASWNMKEGDEFSAGDVLCSIETDKASVDFESQDDGILAKILRDGETAKDLKVGVPICVVVEEPEDVAAFADFTVEEDSSADAAAAAVTEEAAPAAAAATPAAPTATTTATPERDVDPEFALMPSARHLSQSKGVDATVLPGSGKGGRVTKGDVLAALANGTYMPPLATTTAAAAATPVAAAAPAAAAPVTPTPLSSMVVTIPPVDTQGSYEDVANNNMRKVIAKRLTESKREVPHFYVSAEIELDNILKLRKVLKNNHDVKVSVNDLIIRSSALALRDVPEVNSTYNTKTNTIETHPTVDISVAVATPTGLITPIVPQTDTLGLSDISDKVKDLAGRAREGKLSPEEYQGGTFTISNLGMFGIQEFSAVINPPQAAILAVGGGIPTIVPTPYNENDDEQAKPSVKTVMTARLSADRRVVDEATASLFMSALKKYLNQPELLLL
mmetsp:Transcript_12183/g.17346  ORF Transcript_12183/g.17346 Transcript_12183/m.17346 type:complete len:547 (+) Transcript_12183:176-1816(+)